jgi:hypothetical protein
MKMNLELTYFDCELEESPYYTEIFTNIKKNGYTRTIATMYLDGKRNLHKNEFIERFKQILTGNMLNNIDLSKHNAFLTGSSLVPC